MNTDPWYSAYHYSHPPLVERLAAIDESDKKEEQGYQSLDEEQQHFIVPQLTIIAISVIIL